MSPKKVGFEGYGFLLTWLEAFKNETKIYIYGIWPLVQLISKNIPTKKLSDTLKISCRTAIHYKTGSRPISINSFLKLIVLSDYSKEEIFSLFVNHFSAVGCDSGFRNKKIFIPLQISTELIYICGYLYGDGWLSSKDYSIKFVDEYKEQIFIIQKYIKRLFGYSAAIYYHKNKTELAVYSKVIYIFFNKIFEMPIGVKHGSLNIPNVLQKLPRQFKMEFIRGVLDADGGICRIEDYNEIPKWFLHYPQIELSQKSMNFLNGFKNLLIECGFKVLGPYYNKNNKCYKLVIGGKNQIINCCNSTVFNHPIKKQRLNKLTNALVAHW